MISNCMTFGGHDSKHFPAPAVMAMQFPQMHLNLDLNCVKISVVCNYFMKNYELRLSFMSTLATEVLKTLHGKHNCDTSELSTKSQNSTQRGDMLLL